MKNVYYFLSFFATLLLISACSATKTGINDKVKIKILTYNIHHANPPSKPGVIDLAAIAKVINESKADIVGLQELDAHTTRSGSELDEAAELGRLTGMYYYFAKAIDFAGGDYGVAILSRFPIIKFENLKLPMNDGVGGEPRILAAITIEPVKGKQIVFANTHLELNAENRILQARAIVDYLGKSEIPVIFCGDLNSSPGSNTIKLFDEHFTRSIISNGFTFPQDNPDREIDFIMFKPANRFKVLKHDVINEFFASDHRPVMVELEMD